MKTSEKSFYIFLTFLIILSDQISKYIIRSSFKLYEQVDVIKGFFRIAYIKNNGAVWGFFSGHKSPLITMLITLLAILALGIVIYLFIKSKTINKTEILALSFIAGGAIGNIIDRILLGYVVDFIEIYIKQYSWPIFNIADSFISVGIIILIFSILKNGEKMIKKEGDK